MTFAGRILAAASFAAFAAACAAPALADYPGAHPYYLHALGDLRYAHALIDRPDYRPGVDGQDDVALDFIGRAYRDIKAAGIDDGKDINDHFVDPGIDRRGRLRRALEALQKAHFDVTREEQNPAALGLRAHATRDIDAAAYHVRIAIRDNHF
jgi:hypothetical protein